MPNHGFQNRLDQWTRLSRLSFPVPAHAKNLGYCLGGITLTGFAILFLTGLFLTQFFNPQPEAANRTVHYIAEQVTGGRWIRSLHYWTAQAVVLSMCAHLLRVFYTGAYKFPRVLTWYFGVGLFFTATMLAYFSGTVIKWDQEGAEALEHYQFVVGMLGPVGRWLGEGLTDTLSMNLRMYSFHVTWAPLILIFLIVGHSYLIHVFNISPLPRGPHSRLGEVPEADLTGTFTEHLYGIVRFSLIFYGLVAVLAIFIPAPLEAAASAEATGVKPPWIYLWQYGIENFFGMAGILYSSIVLLVLFLIVPVLDRGASRHPRDRKGVLAVGAVTAAALLGFTIYAWVAPKQVHHGHTHGHEEKMNEMPGMEMPEPSTGGHLHDESIPPEDHHDEHSHSDPDEHTH